MKYSLCTLRHAAVATPAIEVAGRYFALSETPLAESVVPLRQGLLGLFDNWPVNHRLCAELADELAAGKGPRPLAVAESEVEFLAPLLYPGKVICTGLNYKDHQRETGLIFSKDEYHCGGFLKPPRTTVVGAGKTLHYPPQTQKLDWELELALVIGRRARSVTTEEALSFVAGYTIAGDMSARDRQFDPRNMGKMQDLIGGKAFDGSLPLGPRIVPAEFVADPQALGMELKVNGAVEISSNTAEMIWSIAEQIEEYSRHMTLEPGDVILTGCPAGVGMSKNRFLKVGDRLEFRIEALGCLPLEIV